VLVSDSLAFSLGSVHWFLLVLQYCMLALEKPAAIVYRGSFVGPSPRGESVEKKVEPSPPGESMENKVQTQPSG